MFLRHEGFLGSIGAWIRNVEAGEGGKNGNGNGQDAEGTGMVQN